MAFIVFHFRIDDSISWTIKPLWPYLRLVDLLSLYGSGKLDSWLHIDLSPVEERSGFRGFWSTTSFFPSFMSLQASFSSKIKNVVIDQKECALNVSFTRYFPWIVNHQGSLILVCVDPFFSPLGLLQYCKHKPYLMAHRRASNIVLQLLRILLWNQTKHDNIQLIQCSCICAHKHSRF